ncbi:MAG: tetratricopeptide repeat protein [Eubacteriales bacterium]|nr:tetratricopeptide repeat protein [Eubacteriales bacterium]
MSSDYILTLEAIDRRLYSKDKSRPLARFSASDLSLPKGNHTGVGLSDECLTYMTELLTKHGRPNLQMNHFLFLHFGGWDALMDYIQADPKRRSFLLRCEEKGYSVASGRAQFDRMLADGDPEQGEVTPSASMRCILEANILIAGKYCGAYSGMTKQDLRNEIAGFLKNGQEEEKQLVPQMNPSDRYAIFRHIRSLLDSFDDYTARGEEENADRALGTALTWLLLAALLRDSCSCLCSLLPRNIQILKVEERESRLSGLPAVASVSQPPRTGRIFKGRKKELEWIEDQFRHRRSPVWITGDGGCGKTSLALQYACGETDTCRVFAPFHEDLLNTIAEIRFQDRLHWEEIAPEELFEFHLSRIARYGSRMLLIIDNFDAEQYDRTFFEMLGAVCSADPDRRTNGDILELLCRTGADILFTTRLFVPPQYPSVCLSAEEHLLTRAELVELAGEIYDDGPWTEAEEVMMEEIILSVGKHVMVVELIAAALKYNAGFSTIEEVLGKVRSGRYAQITTEEAGGFYGSRDVYSQMSRLFSFSAYSGEQQLLLRILSLLPASGLDRGLFMELCEETFVPQVLRAMLLRFRDLHLANVGKTISMHPVTADLASDKLLPGPDNCGSFIRRALAYYEQYSEKNYDYRLLAQISRLLMRICHRLDKKESTLAESGDVRETHHRERAGSGDARETHFRERAVSGDSKEMLHRQRAEKGTPTADEREGGRVHEEMIGTAKDFQAVAAWKASLIEYELGHAQTALLWAREAEAAIAGSGSLRENSPQENPLRENSSREGSPQENPSQESSPQEGLSCPPFSQTEFSAAVCKAAAQAEAALGCFEDALSHYRQAIGLQQSLEGGGVPEIAVTYNDLAVLLYEMEEFDEAGDLLEQALRIQTAAYGPDSIYLSTTFNNQGLLASARGDHEAAAAYYEKSLMLQRKFHGELHPGTAVICCNLGQEYSELSDLDKAEAFFDRALRINTELFGENYAGNAGICNNIGLMYDELARKSFEQGHDEDGQSMIDLAFRWYWKALSILEQNYGMENPHRADLYNNMAQAYLLLGDTKKGFSCFETAAAILEKIFGPDHPRTQAVLQDYASAREWFDRKD